MRKEKTPLFETRVAQPREQHASGYEIIPPVLKRELALPNLSLETRFTSSNDHVPESNLEALKVPKEYGRLRTEGTVSLLAIMGIALLGANNVFALMLLPLISGFTLGRFIQSIKHEPERLRGFSLVMSILCGWLLYNAGSMFFSLLFINPLTTIVGGAILLSGAIGVLIGAQAPSIGSAFRSKSD